MKLRRVLALCLIVVLTIGCLASCSEPTAEELITKADQALKDAPYSVTVDMTLSGDENDEIASQVISMMDGIDMSFAVDGDDIKMSYGMEMDYGAFSMSMDMSMIAIGDTMYIATTQSYDGEEETMKMKATVTDEQRDELLSQTGGSATEMTAADFETVTMEKGDGVYLIKCTDLKEESADKLNGMFAGAMGGAGSVAASNAEIVFEVKDGKYQKATITCDYSIDVGDDTTVTIAASIVMTFNYEGVDVTAPSDAADYEEIDIGDMLG